MKVCAEPVLGMVKRPPATRQGLSQPATSADSPPIRFTPLINPPVTMQVMATISCGEKCGLVLCGLIHGLSRDEVLSPNWGPLLDLEKIYPLPTAVDEVASGSFRNKQSPEIVGSGYVVKSLEAALWAFHNAQDFRQAVLRAVNLGDDADTTGAVCGQFAGAYWGESGIPVEWREGLAGHKMIEQAIRGLLG